MIEDTIARIQARLDSAQSLPAAERQELEDLLTQLRREAASLPSVPQSDAAADEDDVHGALDRLGESLTEFETTHPQLVGIVNRISTILANMGI
jgi:hypothetical protein